MKTLPAWKKGLGFSLTLSVAAALFIFIINFDENTLGSLLKLRFEYLLMAVLLVFLLLVIEGARISLLITAITKTKKISILQSIRIFLFTFFFASVTPLVAGEWPAHIFALNRQGLSLGESSAITVLRSFVSKLTFTVTSAALLIIFQGRLVPTFLNRVFFYALYVSAASTLVLFFLLWKPHVLELLLQKAASPVWLKKFFQKGSRREKVYNFLKQELQEFMESAISVNRLKGGNLFLIIFLTVSYWLCFFSIAPVILLGLNVPVPWNQALIWQIVIQMIIAYVPIPGGSGVAELSLASLFAFFVPSAVLGIFIITWRFFTYYLLLFGGGLALISFFKNSKGKEEET